VDERDQQDDTSYDMGIGVKGGDSDLGIDTGMGTVEPMDRPGAQSDSVIDTGSGDTGAGEYTGPPGSGDQVERELGMGTGSTGYLTDEAADVGSGTYNYDEDTGPERYSPDMDRP
jgi:hypothetical protein